MKALLKKINQSIHPQKLYYQPSWIVLGVNNICNLHCKMCDVGTQNLESNFAQNLVGTKPINMPEELVFKIIDQTAEYFPKAKLGYAFTEPLIYPHLESSLIHAQEHKLFTSITTNALNLKRFGNRLLAGGLNEINISLDGPPEIHNYIRGHKSSFEKAIEGINFLLEADNPPSISIFCVITEWNIGRLVEFAEIFRDIPIKEMGFMHTNFTTTGMADEHNLHYGGEYPATVSNMDEISIDNMDLDLLWKEMEQLNALDVPFNISFSPELKTRALLESFYHDPQLFIGKKCNDIFNNIMIKSNGDVIPAHGRCYNLTIGNLHEQTLKEIWNSEVISRFRTTVNKAGGLLPACGRCCSAFG